MRYHLFLNSFKKVLKIVKVVLFQLRGHNQPQNDATANFFANSERSILGLSNEVSFAPEILWKDG